MAAVVKIATDCFDKKPDGAWVSTANSDIITQDGGVIRIAPGMKFTPGRIKWGVDVAGALEAASANQ